MDLLIARYNSTADATVANTTARGSLIGPGLGERVLRSQWVAPGLRLCCRAHGLISTSGVAGSLTIGFGLGPQAVVTQVFLPAQNLTQRLFEADIECVVRTAGLAGTLVCCGKLLAASVTLDFITPVPILLDLTVDRRVNLGAEWQLASPQNVLRIVHLTLEFHRY